MLPYHSCHIYGTWWSIEVGRKGVGGAATKGRRTFFMGGRRS